MRKKRQFRAGRCYHLVSRIAHRAFFFDEEEKNRFVEVLMAKVLIRQALPDKPKSRFQRYALA